MSQVNSTPGVIDVSNLPVVVAHTKHAGGQQDPPALAAVSHVESHVGNQNPKWTVS